MTDTASIRLSNFIPLSNMHIELTEDEDTGVKHLLLSGIAHAYDRNLKHITIRQTAARKATKRFKAEQDAGRIFQVWIDHAYVNPTFLGNATPTEKVIGHVDEYKFSQKGTKFVMDINPDHPSQIHKAILRRDIDGISIGADVDKENIYCSVDGKQLMSDDCSHYWRQTLDDGTIVGMEVDDYMLDELTITAKQADPNGKVNLSNLIDTTLTFTLNAYDENGDIIKDGLKFKKAIKGESLKNTKKYDKVDRKMTENDIADKIQSNGSVVTSDKFNQLVDAVDNIKQSVEQNNSDLSAYLQAQREKEENESLTQKREIVSRIISKNKEFSEEELMKLEFKYLEKLEKAIIPQEKPAENLNSTFGKAMLYQENDKGSPMVLSRDDIKAWVRLKMGLSAEAPKHIQAKVRARLNGEDYSKDDKFLQYLLDKEKE